MAALLVPPGACPVAPRSADDIVIESRVHAEDHATRIRRMWMSSRGTIRADSIGQPRDTLKRPMIRVASAGAARRPRRPSSCGSIPRSVGLRGESRHPIFAYRTDRSVQFWAVTLSGSGQSFVRRVFCPQMEWIGSVHCRRVSAQCGRGWTLCGNRTDRSVHLLPATRGDSTLRPGM